MRLDADLPAHVEHRAIGALRHSSRADMFAERDKQAVDFNPVSLGQASHQLGHGLFGRAGLDIAPTIGDAMHMDIDADRGLAASDAQGEIRALRANAAKR